ncbi:MAG: rhodanese-like domain-containing protein [Burkholderia sp.]
MLQLSFIDLPGLLQATSDAVTLDLRSQASYWQGHVPDARHVDATVFALPKTDPQSIQQYENRLRWLLSTLGIARDTEVRVYGDALDGAVARAAWALAFAGIERVGVLAGPLDGTPAAFTQAAPAVIARPLDWQPRHALLATADEIAASLPGSGAPLLDARELADYRGAAAPAARSGHIPGALHWDNRHELDSDGVLATPAALAERFGTLGLDRAAPVTVYCGSGPRASRTWLALQRAGYSHARVYQASWSEWRARADLPVEASA